MRILQINKYYPFEKSPENGKGSSQPYPYGGIESNMLRTAELLERHGHEVIFFCMQHPQGLSSKFSNYFVSYTDLKSGGLIKKFKMAGRVLYSVEARKKLGSLLNDHPVDIAHLNNFHHHLSPSILFELRKRKIPVVMSLQEYKMVCPSYRMLDRDKVCELCKSGKFYNSARLRCHKDSFSKSLLVALESYLHRNILHSYKDVKYYICPSKFIIEKLREMGLKGNFVHLPYFIDHDKFRPYIKTKKDVNTGVFWGRLSPEKGIDLLIDAVKDLPVKMTIIGDGPLRKDIEDRMAREKISNIKLLPGLYGKELLSAVSGNAFSVVPSTWYEVFPIVMLEAFSLAMPVIGSRIGGIPEGVRDGETGFLFEPGNADDLRNKIKDLISDPARAFQMGKNAQLAAEKEYDPEIFYQRLIEVYNKAIGKP